MNRKETVKNYFDEDGFPLTRNPGDLIFFSKYLILCKECIKDAQQYIPEFLDNIIEKLSNTDFNKGRENPC